MDRLIMVFLFLFLNILLVSHASPVAEADPDPNVNINIRVIQCVGGNCEPETSAAKKKVKAAFKITNTEFDEHLRDLNSDEYRSLKNEVEDEVKSALMRKLPGKVDYEVEFFRNGSTIVDGTVTTTGQDSETAHKIVYDALRSLGVSWVDTSDASVYVGVRLCVPGHDNHEVQDACAAMKNDISQMGIICVNGRDRYDCLKRLTTKEVDVVRADPADIYLAKELPGADFSVIANIRPNEKLDEQYRYLSVAVVRKSKISGLADLKGKKSCHTGYGKTAGWKVPFAKLLEKGQLTPDCSQSASVVEIDLSAVSSYFSQACIPGPWVPDTDINNRLKTTYSNLCELCGNPSQCDAGDDHAGYQGALKCLVDNNGDVAWTKYDVVAEFFQSRQSVKNDFGLLCPDGSIVDLNSGIDCYWAARTWDAWLTKSSEENKEDILSTLSDAFDNAVQANSQPKNWGKELLGINEISAIKDLNPSVSPYDYLDQAGFYTTISIESCDVAPVGLCVISDIEEQKCMELAAVLRSRRVLPAVDCVRRSNVDDCIAAVKVGGADIVGLDGGDIFKGHIANEIIPIISEVYGKHDATYFAVAVVRENSGITKLADLEGKKSCHTGIQKTAGWKIPTVALIDAGLIDKDECDYVKQVGNFFSESCAPGAKLSKYDPDGNNPDSLCNLCVGDPEASDPLASKCNRDPSETFYNYIGAFRCLVEGGGDVAFIKHTTVLGDTDHNHNHTWNENLGSSDFRLLCKDNTTAAVEDYERCNLAIVPSHKVVTRFNATPALKEQIKILLLRASETLPLGQDVFTMFGDYGSYHDIIFKRSATDLINFSSDDDNQLLNGDYYNTLRELEACQN